jgi:hypothetical protein
MFNRGWLYLECSGEYNKQKGKLVCARNWSSVGRGSYFNAHNFQTIGFQPTSYPKETCASQLDIGNVVSFVHRAPFVYHYRLEDVIVSCLLPFGWLALLKVQGRRIRHFAGHFLSFPGYSVDLEDEDVFIAIPL